jgi:16S rRNA (guanine1207-N2)-methyltransferase
VFGWERLDTGSRLLAEHLPGDLAGRGMDLGCGVGVLALRALRQSPGISEMHLVDEDAMALDCARRNLSGFAADRPDLRIHAHWRDATRETLPRNLDFVLLNPPFHAGRRRDVGLGRAMIRAACASLQPGGRLLLVANRKLPYEKELDASLTRWRILSEREGFKAIKGWR